MSCTGMVYLFVPVGTRLPFAVYVLRRLDRQRKPRPVGYHNEIFIFVTVVLHVHETRESKTRGNGGRAG